MDSAKTLEDMMICGKLKRSINDGQTWWSYEGKTEQLPIVGKRFKMQIAHKSDRPDRQITTSPVTFVIQDKEKAPQMFVFYTKNSVYTFEINLAKTKRDTAA
jgi:hypothetical protein